MIKLVSTLLLTLMLTACMTNPLVPETKIVTVNKPIPFCPAPPNVPLCANYVDALTDADAADPGKVAQAYKLDMTCYRANEKSFRAISDVYRNTSLMASEIEQMFNQLSKDYDKALHPVPEVVAPTPSQP